MNDIKQKMHHLIEQITVTPVRTPRLATVSVPVRVRADQTAALVRLHRRAQAARVVH